MDFNRCKVTNVKLSSYLKLNIFKVFFVVIFIWAKVEQEGSCWLYGTLKRGREPQKFEKHFIILTVISQVKEMIVSMLCAPL